MKKNITILGIPIFFILPWVSYLLSLTNLKSREAALIYIFFAAFFGYSISFSNTSADSYRYALAFMAFERPDRYLDIIQMYISGELRDIYRISIFYFVSYFSSSPNTVYAVAGLLYGLITYPILRLYIQERGDKTDISTLILALILISLCSLSNINGFKFNTGAMLAFYSTYKIIIQGRRIWLFGLLLTPLFHYGFILYIPVILLIKLIIPFTYDSKNIKPIVFYIFFITFTLSFFSGTNLIDISFIANSNLLPEAASNRMEYINSDEVSELVEARAENSLFLNVNSYFRTLTSFYIFSIVIYTRKLFKRLSPSENLLVINKFFAFLLLYYSFANIATSIPSGARFMELGHIFLIMFLCRIHKLYKSHKLRNLIIISIVPFSFKILFINIFIPILVLTPHFWYTGFLGVMLENLRAIK